MSALIESYPGEDDFEWFEKHPERQFGMIDPTNLEAHELHEDFEQVFDDLQQLPPSELGLFGRLHVLVHHEENGNSIASIIIREKHGFTSPDASVREHKIRSISLLKCSDGILRGESHAAKEISRKGSFDAHIEEFQDTVTPLSESEKDIVYQVRSLLRTRRSYR